MRAYLFIASLLLRQTYARIYEEKKIDENDDLTLIRLEKSWFKTMTPDILGMESTKEHALMKSRLDLIARTEEIEMQSSRYQEMVSPIQEKMKEYDNLSMSLENSRAAFREAAANNIESILSNDLEEETSMNEREGNRRNTQSMFSGSGNADQVGMRPLRIKFVTNDLENLLNDYFITTSRRERINFLLDEVLPAAKSFYSNFLKVIPQPTKINISPSTCFGDVNDVPMEILTNGITDADLVMFITGQKCMRPIAGASPCTLSRHDYRPNIGIVYFCVDNPIFSPQNNPGDIKSSEAFMSTIHEMAHILGFNSDLMPYFMDRSTGRPFLEDVADQDPEPIECVDGTVRNVLKPSEKVLKRNETNSGIPFFEVVTPTVTTVVRNQFNCQSMNGARLENQPTASTDCFGSHWDERLFMNEAMSAIYDDKSSFSSLTLALLEDTGWYIGNYSMTQKSTFGHAAGCDFVNEDCIVNGGDIPLHSKGFFCNTPSSLLRNEAAFACSADHRSIGYCDLFDIYSDGLPFSYLAPEQFTYFNNSLLSSISHTTADYCPTIISVSDFSCVVDRFGNTFEDGLCLNIEMGISGFFTAQCSSYECNESLQKLQILAPFSDKKLTCEYDFQQLSHPDFFSVQIECPRLAVMCPDFFCPLNCEGKGVCDHSVSPARCKCFDEDNKSTSCGNI